MTKNQIAYAELLESRRSNLANEEIKRRRDAADIAINTRNVAELERHNAAQEMLTSRSLDETARSNLARELETHRSNVMREGLEARNIAELERHNLAGEIEINRHNIATESETNRHNIRSETQEDKRIVETNRHNVAMEGLQGYSIAVTQQHYKNVEAETHRSNLRMEDLTQQQRDTEQYRVEMGALDAANRTLEASRHNRAVETETTRTNKAHESEISKHNRMTEFTNIGSNAIDLFRVGTNYSANMAGVQAQERATDVQAAKVGFGTAIDLFKAGGMSYGFPY